MIAKLFHFAHRHLWRRLPVRLRRSLLLEVTLLTAPRISRDARAREPLIVVGFLSQASGLGEAARATHDALAAAGVPVFAIDLTEALGHRADHGPFPHQDGRDLVGEGTLVCHVSGPLLPLVLRRLGRRFIRDKRIIAHWFWELPSFPPEWAAVVGLAHEFCVNTEFVAAALQPIAGGRPVHRVTYPLSRPPAPALPPSDGPRPPFTVITVFNVASNFTRKNPLAAIAAFRAAFGDDDDVRLIVKYANGDHWPPGKAALEDVAAGCRNIELRPEILDPLAMEALYASADAVLSLHRSEGLGLVVAEAMLRGIPVIATDWSATAEFLTAECGIPVPAVTIPVVDPQGNYQLPGARWADPDIMVAADGLRRLRHDPELCRKLGQAAAHRARTYFEPDRYALEMRAIVGEA